MTTVVCNSGIYRQQVDVLDGATSGILSIPAGCFDLTLQAIGTSASALKVEKTFSSEAEVNAGTATWEAISELAAVGATSIIKAMGNETPVAFKVTQLSGTKVGKAVLVAKKY